MARRIHIAHESCSRADRIGAYAHGQFMIFVRALLEPSATPTDGRRHLPDGFRKLLDPSLIGTERVSAVLHRFDFHGRHIATSLHRGKSVREPDAWTTAEEEASVLLGSLRGARFQDIAIEPFDVTVNGLRFALFNRGRWFWPDWELAPYELGFGFGWSAA